MFAENERDSETYVKSKINQALFKKMVAVETRREKELRAEKQSEKMSKSEKKKMEKEKKQKQKVR